MTDYFKRSCGSSESQANFAGHVFGAAKATRADYTLYINVEGRGIELLEGGKQDVTKSFTQYPTSAWGGFTPVFASERHLLVELRTANSPLVDLLKEVDFHPVKIRSG